MKKQIFGIVLTAAIAVSCLTMPALAAEPEQTAGTEQQTTMSDIQPTQPAADAAQATVEPEATEAEAQTEAEEPAAEQTPTQTEQPTTDETEAETETETETETEHSFTYVALGDSITAGNGLVDFQYNTAQIGIDASPNFFGYSSDCFVAKVADSLGLDRQHAINLGLPALMSGDMLDLLKTGAMPQMNQPAGTYYVYPQYPEYVKQADVITIQIGSNDALVPFIVSIGNATNWKSEQFANSLVSGMFRDFWSADSQALFKESLNKLTLTKDELKALNYAIGDGMKQICEEAYQDVTANLPQIIAAVRELNPDADIILLGNYNPAWMLSTWRNYFNRLNSFEKQLAENEGLTYIDITWTCTANDLHPSIIGHSYIGWKVTNAIKQQPNYKAAYSVEE